MPDLIVFEQNGQLLTDSREVTMMVEKEHYDLIKTIRNYIQHLTDGKFPVSEYFIESTYTDSTGRELPCYLCTKKGCDMIANKLTGKKGVLFTAKYVDAFEKMKDFIEKGRSMNGVPFPELVQSVEIVANSLRANEASKIMMYHKLYEEFNLPTGFLPNYELNGSRQLKPATTLLKDHDTGMSAIKFNTRMIEHGLLEKKSRRGSQGTLKYYNALTKNGLKYGENAISPYNQKETQPLYYEDTFEELFNQLI